MHASDRPAAIERARQAVGAFTIEGPKTNLPFLAALLEDPAFVSGVYDTAVIDRMQR